MSSMQLKKPISMQKRDHHGLTIKGCELLSFKDIKQENVLGLGWVC